MSITPVDVMILAIFLLIAFPVHEFAHAWAANRQGDATARLFGRMTLNPAVHFDPVGAAMLAISLLVSPFIFGWAKPTPINPANFRDRRNGEVLVALAGPASNLVMAVLGALVVRAISAADVGMPLLVSDFLFRFVTLNVMLAIFNMIPIPPLDGSTLLFRFMSPQQVWQYRPLLTQYGMFIVIAVVLVLGMPLSLLIRGVSDFLVGG